MALTSLTNFAQSEQSNGRYILAPFAWVFALMFSLGHWAGSEQGPAATAAIIAPEGSDTEGVDEALNGLSDIIDAAAAIIDTRPVRPAPRVQPRPIRRGSFFSDLRKPLDLNQWRVSTHTNENAGAFFGGPWLFENIVQEHDRLILQVKAGENGNRPTMAELQTRNRYGYGRYEVIMRPSAESGVVSTFFTYVGPYTGDPHDEIDIEFIGKRSTEIEYNYFKNGRKGAHSREPLEFDISDKMNLYAFEWHPDEIIWFVNGEEHYRSPREPSRTPSEPGNIFISAWTGIDRMHAWTGPPRFGDSAQAEYACVSFTPFEGDSYSCADLWAEDPQFQTENSGQFGN